MPVISVGSKADVEYARSGLSGFVRYLAVQAAAVQPGQIGTVRFVCRIGDDCAYIRLRDMVNPLRFLRQMAGAPPLRFGTAGFAPQLVDDQNPARHYTAFVFVGFWLPLLPALLVLYAWEVAGFVRYHGEWSERDIVCGKIGLRHGALVRRFGPAILPGLVAAELSPQPTLAAK